MEDFREIKARVEALLYAASKPVELRELMSIGGVRSRKEVMRALKELRRKYGEDGGALELVELPGERFFLRLKREYMELVKRFVKRPLFSRGVMRTLSFIAYHQPIEQSRVAAVRGNAAYRHVKLLVERGLVEAEDKGRTKLLRTTQLLADLLGVPNNPPALRKAIASQLSRENSRRGEEDINRASKLKQGERA